MQRARCVMSVRGGLHACAACVRGARIPLSRRLNIAVGLPLLARHRARAVS